MKTLSPGLQALISQNVIVMTWFVKMEFTADLFLCTAGIDIDWDGETWLGNFSGNIDSVRDQGGEIQGLSFVLNGVDPSTISLVLQEEVRGKPVSVWLGLLDPETHAVVDTPDLIWSGFADQMSVSEDEDQATVTVTAEHMGVIMQRPRPFRYTAADQEREYPGDICLQFLNSIATHKDVWPAAAWFKK